jgi:hypothetical protein
MFAPLIDRGKTSKRLGHQKKYYPATMGSYNVVHFSYWRATTIKYYWHTNNQFLEFTSSPICPQTILLACERTKSRKLQ